jgi:hypothetical protein
MGNTACCSPEEDNTTTANSKELSTSEAQPVLTDTVARTPAMAKASLRQMTPEELGLPAVTDNTYQVKLDKTGGDKLGLDVDYMEGRTVLPIMALTGGLAEAWNKANPHTPLQKGDSVIEVNGTRDNVTAMLEKCKKEDVLNLTLRTHLTYEHLVGDLEKLVNQKSCGPILIRLSWHDAGVYSTGANPGGCPNAAMRFRDGGESKFGANAGLSEVAIPLLSNISNKYCPALISHADLWALAANVAIRMLGGPDIPTRFGRVDATSSSESVPSQEGRLPDGDKGADHLRQIFFAKGFDDKDIVALSGAHAVGKCHVERSGFDGAWTDQPLKFDNSYFKNLLTKSYNRETTAAGKPQHKCPVSGVIMLDTDLALIQDGTFKRYVDQYSNDQEAFFNDFSEAWVRMQECGWTSLRDIL